MPDGNEPPEEDPMALLQDMKSLAKVSRSSYPFLTLYLNARWDSEKQRERVRIFVKTKLKEFQASHESTNGVFRQSLQDDVEKIDTYVQGLVNREWDESYSGVAAFACAGLGVYTLVRSHVPFEEAFHCSNRPMLRPAAHQAHMGEPAVLCLVAGDSGRLLEFELGGVRREFSFRDEEFPGRHEQGGWSQARYQRHVEEHLTRNLKRLAEHLVKWVDERKIRRVLLSGPESDLSLFEPELPKRVRQVVVARLRIDPTAGASAIEAEVHRALDRSRAQEDAQAVDEVLDRGPGRGVTGPEAVAEAVGLGKVHVLYLDQGFRDVGWKCFPCGLLGLTAPLGCPTCGAPVETVELGEELVRGALATDGTVIVLSDHAGLRAEGGVAARLRYG
jgi:peptide chain release factor subunit 1